MAVIYVENKKYEVKDGQNVLNACLSLGFDIPYFCWHPAMHSVGACRQCAVKVFKDENDTRGRIVMSCMTPVSNNMRVSVNDDEARKFRKNVIEWLMTNHPHDCPVCDEGGECHLQDMTYMTGHVYRRYRFEKRTYRNQDLGPCVNHEMNRCIHCYRCVRFYRDYAGGRDLSAMNWHNHVYFGRHENGTLESEFSGNLVEVCPTGVFTDKTLGRHYTRKWDLQTAPSICVHCGIGCNTIPGERYGMLRRIRNRYNQHINGYFLCDRGRYGYEFVNSSMRPAKATKNRNKLNRSDAIKEIAGLMGSSKVIGIGSGRASVEANYALKKLVGEENFFAGVSESEYKCLTTILESLRNYQVRQASLKELREADALVVLGEDLPNTAAGAALAVRQAVLNKPKQTTRKARIDDWNDNAVREFMQDERGPLFVCTCSKTRIDDIATACLRAGPGGIARVGFASAGKIDQAAGMPEDMRMEEDKLAGQIAEAIKASERPVIISGTGCGSVEVIKAAMNLAIAARRSGKDAKVFFAVRQCSSMGLMMLGAKPISEISEKASAVIVLENNSLQEPGYIEMIRAAQAGESMVAIDCITNEITERAEYVLPAASFAESDGTFVNYEERAQRFFAAIQCRDDLLPSWKWLRDIGIESGVFEKGKWERLDELIGEIEETETGLKGIRQAAPGADYRLNGQKVARQNPRFSGRTAMYANIDVHEPTVPKDEDSPLAFTMEGQQADVPSSLLGRFWQPGWNSVQSVTKFQEEVNGPLRKEQAGALLLNPGGSLDYMPVSIPEPERNNDGLTIVRGWHIFESDELSVLSPALKARSQGRYIEIHENDAMRIGIKDGEKYNIALKGREFELPVKVSTDIAEGITVAVY